MPNPPPFLLTRGTPRSLSRTLRHMRTIGVPRTQRQMAARLRVTYANLRNFEKPNRVDFSIRFQNLQRYQDLLGLPVTIIVAISQILADARDDEQRRLAAMGKMLRAVSLRISTPAKRRGLIREVLQPHTGGDPAKTTYDDWDNLLGSLIFTAWSAVDINLRNSFVNVDRLDAHDERRRGRPRRAKPARKRRRRNRKTTRG